MESGNNTKEANLPTAARHCLLADEPITLPQHDRLNRAEFAEHLAHSLLKREDTSCLVVSLNAHWGCGKTSLLNLIEGYLSQQADMTKKPDIVRFNPWNISTTDQLIAMLFHEIKTALVGSDKAKYNKQITTLLDVLGGVLTVGQLSPVGSQYFAAGARLAGKAKSKIEEMSKKSLRAIKEDINRLLSARASRIFILIDDADRLDQDSMTLLFRVIRLNADFNNTTYLLTFDKNVVIDMLEEEQPGHGSDYLEKIIQLSIDIPEPEKRRVLGVLDEGLTEYVSNYESDDKHWEKLVIDGRFRNFFTDIRRVKRFLNGMRVNYPRVAQEVDMVDFMGLEAIRIFAPRSYDSIRHNKEILTRLNSSGLLGQPEDVGKTREMLAQIFNPSPRKDSEGRELPESKKLAEVVKDTSMVLFPQLSRVYSNLYYAPDAENRWRRAKRICAEDMFDKYFLLGIPAGELSDEEMRLVLARSNDRLYLSEALDDLFNRQLGVRFLERMEDYTDSIPPEDTEQTIAALFDVGDRIASEPRLMLGVGADFLAASLVYRLLKQVEIKERKNILQNALKTSKTVFLPVYFVQILSPDKTGKHGNADALQELSFSPEDMEELRGNCVDLIKNAAAVGRLSKAPHLGVILYRWLYWGNEREVIGYVNNLVMTQEGLLDFLLGMSTEILSDYGDRRRHIRRSDTEKSIETSLLEPKVKALKQQPVWEKLNALQKELVEAFLNPRKDLFEDE